MKTILVMKKEDYDPTKHQPFGCRNPDPNKAIVCFLCYKSELKLSEDDLLFGKSQKQN